MARTHAAIMATLALWLQQWTKQVSGEAGDAQGGVGRWIPYLVPPAAALLAFSPAGFEHSFRELAEMVGSGAADLDQ